MSPFSSGASRPGCRPISRTISPRAARSASTNGGADLSSSGSWPRSAACSSGRSERPRLSTAEAAARVEARSIAQLLVELLLALGERSGQHDAEIGVEVPRAAVRLGQPLAVEPQLLAARRAGRNFQRDAAFERGDFDLRAQCGLPRRDRDFQMQVVAGHPEQRMRAQRDVQVKVARRAAIGPRPALAAEPQLFAVGDAARDARADAASIQLELALGAARGFLQADVDIDRVVLAAERHVPRPAKPAAAPASECAERLEQVGQVDAAEVLAGVAAEALVPIGRRTEVLPRPVRAEAVEGCALFLVLERLVRLGDLLELLLRVRLLRDVGMVLARELAVSLLDILVARVALDAEDLVIVLVFHSLNIERSIASPPPESWNGRGRGWSRCPAAGR